jgi:oxygen-independent coproporphyrinogen-3 oxidase
MGYTARAATATVALGVSGIAEVEGGWFQNERRLADHAAAVASGRLPIQRGFVLDADDRVRQLVIRRLLCRFEVDKEEIRAAFGIDFDAYFVEARARLAALPGAVAGEPLVDDGERYLRVAAGGRPFVRNVCMAFDRYLEARQAAGRPVFSRTV